MATARKSSHRKSSSSGSRSRSHSKSSGGSHRSSSSSRGHRSSSRSGGSKSSHRSSSRSSSSKSHRKYGPKAKKKMSKVMHEYKHGQLKSGGRRKVKSRKQAIAIGLSEARRSGAKVPPRKKAA
jgi:hypothetical protein